LPPIIKLRLWEPNSRAHPAGVRISGVTMAVATATAAIKLERRKKEMASKSKKGSGVVLASKGQKSEGRKSKTKKAAVKQEPWWAQPRWIGSIVGGIAVVALIVVGVVWGPALFSTGRETPRVISFTLASETVAEDECPVFNFEVANAKRITITQDDEVVMDIEITVTGASAAYHQPRQGEAYALTETQPGVETHYSPGVFPIGFKGASNGKPLIWEFGDGSDEKGGSAVLEVSSWDGQVVKAEVTYNIVPASERPSDQRPVITAPDCVKQDASSTADAKINYFRLKNQTMEPSEQPEFEFWVENTGMMKIMEGDECVFYIQATTPGAAHQPRQGEAYALTETQPGVETHYSPGIYPVGFKGASNGKPTKEIWKFGDKGDKEPSATIIVCSPKVELTDVVPFCLKCGEGCSCMTEAERWQNPDIWYTTKCERWPCGCVVKTIDGKCAEYKYCYSQCPEGCECLDMNVAMQKGYSYPDNVCFDTYIKECRNPSIDVYYRPYCYPSKCPQPCQCLTEEQADALGYTTKCDETLCREGCFQEPPDGCPEKYCFRKCPEGCDCMTLDELGEAGCYSGTAVIYGKLCVPESCGVDEYGNKMYCCTKQTLPPVIECSLSSTSLPVGGGYIYVSWTSQNADEVTLSIGSATPGQVSLTGNLGASVTKDTCFTFTATNEYGTSTVECCVDVEEPPPLPAPRPQPQPTPEPEPPCEPESPPPPG